MFLPVRPVLLLAEVSETDALVLSQIHDSLRLCYILLALILGSLFFIVMRLK